MERVLNLIHFKSSFKYFLHITIFLLHYIYFMWEWIKVLFFYLVFAVLTGSLLLVLFAVFNWHTLFNNYFHVFLQSGKINFATPVSLNHVFPVIIADWAQLLRGWWTFGLFKVCSLESKVLQLSNIDTENVKRFTKCSSSPSYRHLQRFSIMTKRTLQ